MMTWDCRRVEEKLSEYVDGLLAANERGQLEAHCVTCTECREALRQTQQLVRAAGRLGGLKAPVDLWPAVRQRLRPPVPRRWWSLQPIWRPVVAAASVAGVIVAVVLTTWLPSHQVPLGQQVSAPVLREYAEQRSAQAFAAGDAFVFAAEVESSDNSVR
jgi:anti-sigma factor RsiW